MSGVHDDLATLKAYVESKGDGDTAVMGLLDRVEAEVARLERELDEARKPVIQAREASEGELGKLHWTPLRDSLTKAEAAEAEVVRLRDGLREMAQSEQATTAGYVEGEVLNWEPTYGAAARDLARALLAEDGAALIHEDLPGERFE